jgi:DNA invertase Pin-like site-specific DNA recombinase
MDKRGVDLVFLDQGIDTSTPMGKMLLTILGAVAEYERAILIERTRDGLAVTKARGREGGRKHRLSPQQQDLGRKLRAEGHSVREIGVLLGNGKPVSRQTVYRALSMIGPDPRRVKHETGEG